MTKHIQHAIEASVYTPQLKNSSFILPDYIKLEIMENNCIRCEWQRNRNPTTKCYLKSKISLIRTLLETYKTDQWDTFLNSLDHQDGSIYKLNKCLLHKRPASHPLTGPNGLVFQAFDRAELIADSLERQFQTNPDPDLPEVTVHNQSLLDHNITKLNLFITPGTIQNMIRDLRKKKVPVMTLLPIRHSNSFQTIFYYPERKSSTAASESATFSLPGKKQSSFPSPSQAKTIN
jgi:hypothetical protein